GPEPRPGARARDARGGGAGGRPRVSRGSGTPGRLGGRDRERRQGHLEPPGQGRPGTRPEGGGSGTSRWRRGPGVRGPAGARPSHRPSQPAGRRAPSDRGDRSTPFGEATGPTSGRTKAHAGEGAERRDEIHHGQEADHGPTKGGYRHHGGRGEPASGGA